MMMDFLQAVWQHFALHWAAHFSGLMVASVVLGLALSRVTRRMMPATVVALLLFVLLLSGAATAAALQAASLASALRGAALLLLGMWLIRQCGLAIFRLLFPRLGLHPPRILEELLILFAYIAWVLIALSQAGLDLGSLVASTAVLTAVVAFAMQDTLGNILSGLALQLDHSIHIGDWLDMEGIMGEVIQVQWRHTAVRTPWGEKVLIPNSHLMKAQVKIVGGQSAPQRVRVVTFHADAAIAPADVLEEVDRTLAESDLATVSKDPAPSCVISDLSQGMVSYAVRYWLTNPSAMGSTDSLIFQHVHAIFQRRGWALAAPAMDIHWSRQSHGAQSAPPHASDLDRRLQCVQACELFHPLTDAEHIELAQRLKTVPFVQGGLVARQGEQGDFMYIVVQGRAAVWLEAHGQQHLLAEVGPGQVIGEMSLMTGEPRRATLRALTHMVCYALSKEDFQKTLKQRPALAEMFAQLLARRNQELTQFKENVPRAVSEDIEKAAILARIRRIFRL